MAMFINGNGVMEISTFQTTKYTGHIHASMSVYLALLVI